MNEFAIEWIKGADYAGITVPSGTALKSKLLRLAEKNPEAASERFRQMWKDKQEQEDN